MRFDRALRRVVLIGAALVLGFAMSWPALAAVGVVQRPLDTSTQGNWPGVYGDCFFLIPNPRTDARSENCVKDLSLCEEPTGPDWFEGNQDQYLYENCFGGPLFMQDPDESGVDWRLFINNADDSRAFAYTLSAPYPPRGNDSWQWNPCRQQIRPTTWDNLGFANDPMSAELRFDVGGSFTVAYYFVDSINVCRDLDYTFFVDDVEAGSGSISDFKTGVYVVFDLTGVVAGTTVRLETRQAAIQLCRDDPDTEEPSYQIGQNSVISSVFIGGDCPTDDCPDEDDDDPGDDDEDDPGDEDEDGGGDDPGDEDEDGGGNDPGDDDEDGGHYRGHAQVPPPERKAAAPRPAVGPSPTAPTTAPTRRN